MLKIKIEEHTLEFTVIETEDAELTEKAAVTFAKSILSSRAELDEWTYDGTLRESHDRVRVFFVR